MSKETKRQFEQEEQAYWRQRDELLKRYPGKWVAVVGGEVVAVADQMNKAAAEAFRKTKRGLMFVALVGEEDILFRIRRRSLKRDPLSRKVEGISDAYECRHQAEV